MSSDFPIDIASLLEPSEFNADHAEVSGWIEIKDLYRSATGAEKEREECEKNKGVDATGQPWRKIPPADWDSLIDKSIDYLKKFKDFRVAGWLTGALLAKHQLNGLQQGLQLCLDLAEKYWDVILPAPTDEDGHFDTVAGIRDLSRDFSWCGIGDVVLLVGKMDERQPAVKVTYRKFKQAQDLKAVDASVRADRIEAGQHPIETIQSMAGGANPVDIRGQLAVLDQCVGQLETLTAFLQTRCQKEASDETTYPDTGRFKADLEALSQALRETLRLAAGSSDTSMDDGGASAPTTVGQAKGESTAVASREAALLEIEKIACYFEKNEPHTPIHFGLRQIVRWGRMPLDKLFLELIEDQGTLILLQKRIGLPQHNPTEESK